MATSLTTLTQDAELLIGNLRANMLSRGYLLQMRDNIGSETPILSIDNPRGSGTRNCTINLDELPTTVVSVILDAILEHTEKKIISLWQSLGTCTKDANSIIKEIDENKLPNDDQFPEVDDVHIMKDVHLYKGK